MVIADVPTPVSAICLFPMTQGTNISGIILPSYNDSNNRGFFAKRRVLFCSKRPLWPNFLGDYYTNGSYGMRFESSYVKKICLSR
jgi:hypothetical protein